MAMQPPQNLSAPSDAARTAPRGLPAATLGMAFVLLWCSGYPAAKIALTHGAPFTLLTLRFACAGLIWTILALSASAWPRGRAAWHSAVVGALSLALQFGGVYLSVALGVNIGITALVIGTMPIVTALMGLSLGEAVRPLQWFGFALGFGGVALAVGERIGAGGDGAGLGAYLALFAGLIGVSAGTLYQKRHASAVDLRAGLAVQHLVAALLLLPLALYEGLRLDGSAALGLSVGWMVTVNSLLAFALFFVLLRRGAVNQVATLFFLMPPVTAVVDYLVLGDPLSVQQLAGLALAAGGVYLATRPPAARRAPAAAAPPALSRPRAAIPQSCRAPGG
jgi:drug/metabolite transporter (DMT)-like permease